VVLQNWIDELGVQPDKKFINSHRTRNAEFLSSNPYITAQNQCLVGNSFNEIGFLRSPGCLFSNNIHFRLKFWTYFVKALWLLFVQPILISNRIRAVSPGRNQLCEAKYTTNKLHQLRTQNDFPLRSATVTYIYEGRCKSNIFFSETVITLLKNITYIVGISFTKLRFFSPHTVPHCQHNFFISAWDAMCRTHSSLLKCPSASRMLCCRSLSSAKMRLRTAFFRGPKRWMSEGAKSGLYRGWGLD
jgi:hypothetical protein